MYEPDKNYVRIEHDLHYFKEIPDEEYKKIVDNNNKIINYFTEEHIYYYVYKAFRAYSKLII